MSATRAIDLEKRRELRRAEQSSLRRMADRRRRRALPDGTEREGGIEAVYEIPLTTEKLRSSDVVEGTERNGGGFELRRNSTMAAAASRVLRRREAASSG